MILTLVTQLAKRLLVHYNQVLVYSQSQFYDTTKSNRFLLSELSLFQEFHSYSDVGQHTHNTYNDKEGYLWGSYGTEK